MRCDLAGPDARCPACGFIARRRDGSLVRGAIRNCPGRRFLPDFPFGDWTAMALGFVGVTSDRVSAWLGRDCGCDGRRRRWNAAGARLSARLNRAIGRVVDWRWRRV